MHSAQLAALLPDYCFHPLGDDHLLKHALLKHAHHCSHVNIYNINKTLESGSKWAISSPNT